MSLISLNNNKGKSWIKFNKSYIKGFAFIGNTLLSEREIYENSIQAIIKNLLPKYLASLDGNYSMVIEYNNTYYLISDKIRSYPLFYLKKTNNIIISDDTDFFIPYLQDIQWNELSIVELLSLGYLSENRTLFKDLFIVEAGNYVSIHNENITIYKYYEYIIHNKISGDKDYYIKKAKETIEKAFSKMLQTIGSRQIVIPLSGGYDSRLIACLCKRYNLSNVICFSYGRLDSWEAAISKKVAVQLDFKWYFIEYTNESWESICKSEELLKYFEFSGNFNSTPHIQDFYAIKSLTNSGIIDPDAIVIPGHSGDLLGGSHLLGLSKKISISNLIFQRYYTLNTLKRRFKDIILKRLYKQVGSVSISENLNDFYDIFNNWGINVRQVNFIINSVRVYEFFGLDWRVPLWDDEFASYWISIPWLEKLNSELYNSFLFESYFEPYQVTFKKTATSSSSVKLLRMMYHNLPDKIKFRMKNMKNRFSKQSGSSDINSFGSVVNYYNNKNGKLKEYTTNIPKSINEVLAIEYIKMYRRYSSLQVEK